jgi:hypothetical protein
MADEPETTGGDAESASSEDAAQDELVYESNPKHSDPWQIGKKGSICDQAVRPLAADLLRTSIIWKGKRYAVHEGRAYCAQEHSPNRWHGYPVGWVEVPPKLARQWMRDGNLTNHDRKKYWEAH